MKIVAIIPAAGSSSRFLNGQKLLFDLNGKSVIETTISRFDEHFMIDEIIICTSQNIIEEIKKIAKNYKKVTHVIEGGATRQESVFKGLSIIDGADFVAIHDGARPFIDEQTITNTLNCAIKNGHASCGVRVKDTIKKVEDSKITYTPNRDELWQIQTPQVFLYDEIYSAHKKYQDHAFSDDTLLIEQAGGKVFVVEGDYKNIKITTPEDIEVARLFAKM